MDAILIPGFWLLAGICGYAAIVHGLFAFRQATINYTHLLFAGMCFLAIPFSISHTIILQTVSSELFIEALRWHHPEMGNIPPSIFIPVAEEAGLIHAIGSWVLDEAVAKLAGWLKMGVPYTGHLSVNVSAWQFARVDFVEQVRQVLGKYQIMPSQLMLEVTETALLYDFDQTVSKLKEMRALGVQTSLDDFGTGYSSLAYLKDLPLDELKIDKAFIDELLLSQDHTLVETIMAIGRCMRLKVIAEGVESVIQRDALLAMGCMQFQGYLFSRPLPEDEFVQWIALQKVDVAGV